MCCNRGLFGGNTCTWVLILVLVFLLVKQNDNGYGCENECNNGCNNCANDTAYNGNNYGCGCGCC